MIDQLKYLFFISAILLIVSCEKIDPPGVVTFSPEFGPPETLIIVEGMGFDELTSITFSDNVPADFNPSYGSADALLFRVPEDATLGDNVITIENVEGKTAIEFRVTQKPPSIFSYSPESAQVGETVTILGEHFFEPMEVLFFDSVSAKVLFLAEDSMVVEVPTGVTRGRLKVKANGGSAVTSGSFFTTKDILINDFDGNGLRSETNKWIFYGNLDQNANTAVNGEVPIPMSGNFLKISGKDPGSVWIGGTENHSWDVDMFDVFPIDSDINNTFIEMDLNSNGRDKTHVIIILVERNGSSNDFTTQVHADWDGWQNIRIPLNRFQDLDGSTIDPQKIKAAKIHLINNDGSSGKLEINVDNLKFVQIN